MKTNKYLMTGLASLTLLLGACGGGGSSSEESSGGSGSASEGEKVLEMGTSADFAPFESRNPDGEIVGFDIDLANHIAEELGYELEVTDMKFDGLIGALQADRIDMVLSGMSATDERKQNVDFSVPYNHSGEMFLTQKGSDITALEDIEGKTVGVQLGTIQEDGANTLKENEGMNFEIKAIDNSALLIQELMSNRVDVVYMDKAVAQGYMEEQGLEGFDDPTTSSPGMAVAFPKGSELVEDVNSVITEMEESGELQELKEKWKIDE